MKCLLVIFALTQLCCRVLAACENSDIAAIIGSRYTDHVLSDIRAAQQTSTLNVVMGAIDTYRVADRAAEIIFLDYEDCEVKWMKAI